MKVIRLLTTFIFLIFLTGSIHAETPVEADSLKAAYIYHFLNFTDWNDNLNNYYVCVPDDDILKETVQDSLKGKTVNHRGVIVLSRSRFCHILVSDQPSATRSTLTIGSLNKGALLEFRVVKNKLKFAVNMDKIKNSRLKISSQLLKLAILEHP